MGKYVVPFVALWLLHCLQQVENGSDVNTFNPPNGSTVSTFEGSNATFICELFAANKSYDSDTTNRLTTEWSVLNFNGSIELVRIERALAPSDYLILSGNTDLDKTNSTLILLQVSRTLNGASIVCGDNSNPQVAIFPLIIYRALRLREMFTYEVKEGSYNVSFNLLLQSADSNLRNTFIWMKDGHLLHIDEAEGITFNESTISLDQVWRSDSGNYSLTITSHLDNRNHWITTGWFFLEVLYGPYITLSNQTEQIVIAGDSTLLLCGTGLHSNPQASVKWHKPDGTTIKPHNHIVDYFVHDGPEYVNVNISSVSESDEGLWSCEISVMDNDADQSDEDVNDKPMNNGSDSITITFEIHLIVLSPPSQPQNLTVESISDTWAGIRWLAPTDTDNDFGVTHYNITICDNSCYTEMISAMRTVNNVTQWNITRLQPGIVIQVRVVAITSIGDLTVHSPVSASINVTTNATAPSPLCDSIPILLPSMTDHVILAVNWSYIQNRGLPITRVEITPFIIIGEGQYNILMHSSQVLNVNKTSVNLTIPSEDIRAGTYVVNVTATNNNGSSSISCPSTTLERTIIQIVLSGEFTCSEWVITNTEYKLQSIEDFLHDRIQSICRGCGFLTTNQAIECSKESTKIVKFRAKLFSTLNVTTSILDAIRASTASASSLVVGAVRLYFERDCPLVIESFESPLSSCFEGVSSQPDLTTGQQDTPANETSMYIALTVTAFMVCLVLFTILGILMVYLVYKRYLCKNLFSHSWSHTDNEQTNLQQTPPVGDTGSRFNTIVTGSRPGDQVPDDGEEKVDHGDFELSTSLAYGAVCTPSSIQRQRLGSNMSSISESVERTYNNPLYVDKASPIYEDLQY